MLLQRARHRERHFAEATFICVLAVSTMGLHVPGQLRALGACVRTELALIRLLAGVTTQVTLQQPGSREHLAANAAAVGELVREHVHRQGGHADVRLAAVNALFGRFGVEATVRLLVPR